MRCWGELKSLRAQSVGEVTAYYSGLIARAIFRICGNESQPGLQLVCLVPRRVLADSRATGILVPR